jgi:hypothetical protein
VLEMSAPGRHEDHENGGYDHAHDGRRAEDPVPRARPWSAFSWAMLRYPRHVPAPRPELPVTDTPAIWANASPVCGRPRRARTGTSSVSPYATRMVPRRIPICGQLVLAGQPANTLRPAGSIDARLRERSRRPRWER